MTMPAGTVEYIEKKHSDLILAGSDDVKELSRFTV